jgi:hypothetical protein
LIFAQAAKLYPENHNALIPIVGNIQILIAGNSSNNVTERGGVNQ